MEKQAVEVKKIKKLQVEKFLVTKGETVEFNGNTKMEHDLVKGIFINLSNKDALSGATLRVWIDDTEILPVETEASIIHFSESVSIFDKAYPVDVKAKNSPIRIIYKDSSENLAVDDSYYVRVYLLTEVHKKIN